MSKKELRLEIGSIVEDAITGDLYQILDKGSNYITVATTSGQKKKWLNEVKETEKEPSEFSLTETNQISCFGYETKNLQEDSGEILLTHLEDLKDLYAQHQVIKCLDEALATLDENRKYELLERVQSFFEKKEAEVPLILEAEKFELERSKILNIFTEALGIERSASVYSDYSKALEVFETLNEKQKQILAPITKLLEAYGVATTDVYDRILNLMEDNLSDLDLEIEDLDECFSDDEFSEDLLTEETLMEVLSVQGRMALARDLKRRSSSVTIKRERALNRSANTTELLSRARKLALTMIKRRMFRKPADQLSRAEKERFEGGASKRKALVARLAQKLVAKVRLLQNDRLHHAPVTKAEHTGIKVSGAS